METVTEQPIIKIEFFRCPQSLPGVAPLTKKPEDSGYEIGGLWVRDAPHSPPPPPTHTHTHTATLQQPSTRMQMNSQKNKLSGF